MLRLLTALLLTTPAWANVPAAYLACDGAAEGDPCVQVGPQYGKCIRDTLCTPDPTADVDICLLCVDPCWDQAAATECVRRDGTAGVCVTQDQCTDDATKSFLECNRCVEGRAPGTDPEPGGCTTADVQTALPWALLLILLGVQARRRRPA
jgi:MYXO-CTERM domain-containing protein